MFKTIPWTFLYIDWAPIDDNDAVSQVRTGSRNGSGHAEPVCAGGARHAGKFGAGMDSGGDTGGPGHSLYHQHPDQTEDSRLDRLRRLQVRRVSLLSSTLF